MAWEVIWSPRAIKERSLILQFWLDRNQSYAYPVKLNSLINDTISSIQLYPYSGKRTTDGKIRVIPIKSYLLFYEIGDSEIIILSFWDTRQDPSKLKI